MQRYGIRTADQLVLMADVDADTQERLRSEPRRTSERLVIGGQSVLLRDQGPLFARKDLSSILGDGLRVADWIRLPNRRVYLFTDQAAKNKLLSKYVESDGAQDVITFSPRRLLAQVGPRVELASQNTGAIARRTGVQKDLQTFQSMSAFPTSSPRRSRSSGA